MSSRRQVPKRSQVDPGFTPCCDRSRELRLAWRHLLTILPLIATLSSCGYALSGKNRFLPPTIHTIAIPVFANETRRAEIEQRITESLLDEFIKRGDYVTQPQREGADALLEGAVTGYSATPVTLTSQGSAQRLEVVVQARVRLSETRTGKILWSQEHFIFRSQYDVERGPAGSVDRELVAIDRIAGDFAETVVTSILEGF